MSTHRAAGVGRASPSATTPALLLLLSVFVAPLLVSSVPLAAGITARQKSDAADDAFEGVRESLVTARVAALFAAVPVVLLLLSHLLLVCSRACRSWLCFRIALVVLMTSKLIAMPLGIALLVGGVVVASLEISLVGVSLLALIYTAQIGSWNAAWRLAIMLRWLPDVYRMERWHLDGRGNARVFRTRLDKSHDERVRDPYRRAEEFVQRMLRLANDGDSNPEVFLAWRDQIVLALLALKFVSFTAQELAWQETTYRKKTGDMPSILSRWTKGWLGHPGKWLRQWLSAELQEPDKQEQMQMQKLEQLQVQVQQLLQLNGHAEQQPPEQNDVQQSTQNTYEKTLQLIVVIFECIRRSDLKKDDRQRKQLLKVLSTTRDMDEGSMQWLCDHVKVCIEDENALRKVFPPEPQPDPNPVENS